MFFEFYQLREQPFGVTPDPRFLYFGATHREALASLVYSIEEKRGFSAIVAEPGMGKTSLLFRLLESLGGKARTAFLFQTDGDTRDLLHSLLADLGISSSGRDLVSMRAALHGILLEEMQAGRHVVAVIDEAQNLDDEALESVRMLSNFETAEQKLMHIVLAGQPSLAEKLASPRLVQLRQRIASVIRLEPFGLQETEAYVQHRLRAAGHSGPPIFAPEAYEMIARVSQGIPRNISSLCFQALSLGFAMRARTIGVEIISEVLCDCDFAARPAPRKNAERPAAVRPEAPEVQKTREKVETSRAVSVPPSPQRAPKPVGAVCLPPVPGFVSPAPARRSAWTKMKWIAVPTLAAAAVFGVPAFSDIRFELNGEFFHRLYGQAANVVSKAGGQSTSSASVLAAGKQPAPAEKAKKDITPAPAAVPVESEPPASTNASGSEAVAAAMKEVSAKEVSAKLPAKVLEDHNSQQTVIVTSRQTTPVEISQQYLGGSDWHTVYRLLAENPQISWSQQDIPKGTRIVLPKAGDSATAPAAPAAGASGNPTASSIPAALPEAHKGPAFVAVSHNESIFQLALENYGKASWVIVSEICKANPQLRGVYDVLREGDVIRLPDPADFETKTVSQAKSRRRQ